MALAVDIVPATREHVEDLAPRLRQADVDECLACGEGPHAALTGSVERSVYARALLFEGRAEALWGVIPVQPERGLGAIRMLGSDELTVHRITFWRLCRPELAKCLEVLPILLNFVDGRYAACLRWAKRLGFEIHPARPLRELLRESIKSLPHAEGDRLFVPVVVRR